MLIQKNWTSLRIAKNLRQKEIDKLVQKFFVYLQYRQNLRYSMKNGHRFNKLSKSEQQQALQRLRSQETFYRLMRQRHIDSLEKLNTRDSCISRMNFRCNLTGKNKVHNKWIKISTVPLRHILRLDQLPGWQRANW